MSNAPCAFCGIECSYQEPGRLPGGDIPAPLYNCPQCGSYILDRFLGTNWKEMKGNEAFKIACLVREKQLGKNHITYALFHDGFQPGEKTYDKLLKRWWRISELLAEFPKPNEIIDRSLLNLSRLTLHPMDTLEPKDVDLPFLLFCPADNVRVQWSYMKDMDVIRDAGSTMNQRRLTITPRGWSRIQELSNVNPQSKQAFVAMWFDPGMQDTEDAIRKGIEDAGYLAQIIKYKKHNNDICLEIIAEIRKSRFVVADFTAGCCKQCADCETRSECKDQVRPRGGVYYEAGFAKGLGLEVIWLVHESQKDQIHFDTSHFNHLVYSNPGELTKTLKDWIEATIH